MKRLLCAAIPLLTSCGLVEVNPGHDNDADRIWHGPSVNPDVPTCWSTAFIYPSGEDWRGKGDCDDCTLAVYAGLTPVLKVKAGKTHEISSDPEKHRVISGHLYTDFSDGETVVVKKDGKEIFRYAGSEKVIRMLVHDESVHTLCVPYDNQGFCYRVDGQAVLERTSGKIFRWLGLSDGVVVFFFSHDIKEASGVSERHYMSKDGTVVLVDLGKDVEKVWDIKLIDGQICAVLALTGRDELVLSKGGERTTLKGVRDVLTACFLDSDGLCVNVRYMDVAYGQTSVFWNGERGWSRFYAGRTASAAYMSDNRLSVVYDAADEFSFGTVICGNVNYAVPSVYSVRGLYPMVDMGDALYLGLSSDDGPVVWIDGKIHPLRINGYIARMSSSDDISG